MEEVHFEVVFLNLNSVIIDLHYFVVQIKNRDEMEKRTETGLVMGHAYGVTAIKKVQLCYVFNIQNIQSTGMMELNSFSIYFYNSPIQE